MSSSQSSTNSLRIGIIGGGPAGLILARTLQVHGVKASITIYEGEPAVGARFQGGSLDLRTKSGQVALNHAGLMDQFRRLSRPEGQEMKLLDKFGKIYFHDHGNEPGKEFSKPEIDRGDLRNIFLESLESGTVRWGCRLEKVVPIEDVTSGRPRYQLRFANSEEDTIVDLVVGADGTWSKVRPLVSPASPFYSGTTFIESYIPPATLSSHPVLDALVGHGSAYALEDSKALMGQRNTGGGVRVQSALAVPESWLDDTKSAILTNPTKSLQYIVDLFKGWNDGLLDLVRYSDPTNGQVIPRRLYMLPVDHSWAPRQGITLVGDAAHVMTPFAGEGANIALLDGAELALEISDRYKEAVVKKVESLGWLDEAVVAYEKVMFERSEFMAKMTEKSLRASMGPEGVHALLRLMPHESLTE